MGSFDTGGQNGLRVSEVPVKVKWVPPPRNVIPHVPPAIIARAALITSKHTKQTTLHNLTEPQNTYFSLIRPEHDAITALLGDYFGVSLTLVPTKTARAVAFTRFTVIHVAKLLM